MKRFHFFILAPYEEFYKNAMEAVQAFDSIDFTVRIGNEYTAPSIFSEYPLGAFNAIITRGANTTILREFTSIPVIEVNVSIFDILKPLLKLDYTNRKIAIVGYHNIVSSADKLADILDCRQISIFDIKRMDIPEIIPKVKNEGFEIVLGDDPSVALANKLGMQGILIQSSVESIKAAISEALYYSRFSHSEMEQLRAFRSLLNGLSIPIVIAADTGRILFTNELFNHSFSSQTIDILCEMMPVLVQENDITTIRKLDNCYCEITGKNVLFNSKNYLFFILSPIQKKHFAFSDISLKNGVEIFPSTMFINLLIDGNNRINQVADLIRNSNRIPAPLLISGEYGTGKKAIARYMHSIRQDSNHPVLYIRCDILSSARLHNLLSDDKSPLCNNRYTVFLENIDTLSLDMQSELASYIENTLATKRHFFIASSIENLNKLCSEKRFSYSLFNLLSTVQINLPPLRDTPEKLPKYLSFFYSELCGDENQKISFSPNAKLLLESHPWELNLKELYKFLNQLVLLSPNHEFSADEIRPLLQHSLASSPEVSNKMHTMIDLSKTLEEIDREVISRVLAEENMNRSKAAKRLGINRNTIWRKLG